jgi:S1-C subfamily serine protease
MTYEVQTSEGNLPRRNQRWAKRVGFSERRVIVAISILLIVVTSIASYSAGFVVGSARLNAVNIYAHSSRSVVTIQGDSATQSVLGSGFVIRFANSNYVVTNFHVVDGMTNVTVTFWDGNSYATKVMGSDGYEDAAILAVSAPSDEFYPLRLGSSSSLSVGDPVAAIGNPYGLSGSITVGIVGQLGRTIQSDATTGGYAIADVIQFSAPVNPGNSGGPLLNANDLVVGVTTAQVIGSQGLGFAIPSNTIARELPSLVNTGTYAKHPYLGIAATDMNYQLSQVTHGTVTYGVLVEKSVSNGPASMAGVKGGTNLVTVAGQQYLTGGDIIISINGARIVNNDALSTYLERYTLPGEAVQVGIIRNGEFISVQVTLGTRPPL